jgi:S-methylmethionine-dependent homocysteine/selenocysteine methylase
MPRYRDQLPQLSDEIFLADGGLETDLIFNRGTEVREFAAHTLLPDPESRGVMANYFRSFLALARELNTGFILDGQTWKAHTHWSGDLNEDADVLRRATARCRQGNHSAKR